MEKQEFEITWPNIIRVDHVYHPDLHLDEVEPIYLDPYENVTQTEMAAIIAGKPNFDLPRVMPYATHTK